jgi:CHAT domain-containing protein
LTDTYGITEDQAETIIDWIASNPEVSLARPQTESELQEATETVEQAIIDLDLSEFDGISDESVVRKDLMTTLRENLGLRIPSAESTGVALSAANRELVQFDNETEIPEEVRDRAQEFVDLIENENNDFTYQDWKNVVEAVDILLDRKQ